MKRTIFLKKNFLTENISAICKSICIIPLLIFVTSNINAANRTASANGNWSSTTTWGGSSVPTSGDAVTINGNVTVTVDNSSAVCSSLSINPSTSGQTGTVNYSGSSSVLTVSGAVTLGGGGTKLGVLDMSSGGTIKLTGAFTINANSTFTTGTGTMEYNSSGAQTVLATTYKNLTVSGGNTKTLGGTITVNGNLSISSSTTLSTSNNAVTLKGDFTNSGTFSAGSSSITFDGTSSQSIAGFTTTGTVSMTKTGGTATLSGNVNGNGLTINGSGGTLNLGTSLTHTFTGTWTRTNGTLDNGTSTLKLGAGFSGTGGTFTATSGGTVEWYLAGSQTIAAVEYNNLTISGGGSNTKTLSGATTVDGTLSISSSTTLSTSNNALTLKGNFTNSGTFSAGSSSITFDGTSTQSIAGFTTTGTVSMTKTGGTATLNGDVTGVGFTMNGSGGSLNLGTSHTHTFTGTWTLTAGDLYGSSSTLKIGGSISGSGITLHGESGTVQYTGSTQTIAALDYYNLSLSTASGTLFPSGTVGIAGTFTKGTISSASQGTINFNGSAQTVPSFTYNNLTLSGSGGSNTKTLSSVTVNGILSMEGTATVDVAPTYGSAATLQYNTTTARTAGSEWITPFAASGGLIIGSTGTITLDAAKTFNLNVPLTINSGASLNTSSSGNFGLTLGGDFINNGGTFSANGSDITIGNTRTTQSIAGFTTTGTVSMTKTAGTATFSGDVNGGAFTLNGSGGTLNLGTSHTHTFTGTFTMTAGDLYCSSSTLKLGSGTSGLGVTFHEETGTVQYNGSSQAIAALNYNNLSLSGATGTTFPSGTVGISGTFTIGTISSATQGTINFKGSTQTVPGTFTYNNLTLSNSGTKTLTSVTVTGVLSLEGTATVSGTPTYGSAATLQYNTSDDRNPVGSEWVSPFTGTGGVIIGNGKTITMDADKIFGTGAPLTINTSSTLSTSGSYYSVTFGGNFTNSGTFTVVNSAITISGTATQTIAGFTTTGTVSMTKTGGTATFSGDVTGGAFTINGSGGTLDLGTSHIHTFTGTWTLTAGSLNCNSSALYLGAGTSGSGVTFSGGTGSVNYYGTGAYTMAPLNYSTLRLTNASGLLFPSGIVGISGTFTPANITSASAGTINFNGSNQTIPVFNYNDLDLTNATSVTFASGTVGIAGTFTKGTTTSASQGTISFNGSSQTVPSFTYNNLTLSNSGTKTLSSVTVNGVLSMEGTATATISGTLTYGSSATLQYNTSDDRTAEPEWVTPFTASGGIVIVSARNITLDAARTLNTSVPLRIASGATLNTTTSNYGLTVGGAFINDGTFTANGSAITFNGDFTNNGTFNGGSCSVTIGGTGTQNIAGFTTTGSVTMTKTGGTATLTGDVTAGALNINGSNGTLNLGTSRTHAFSGTCSWIDGTLNGGTATILRLSGLVSTASLPGTIFTFTKGTSTVNYCASTAYSIVALDYYNLDLTNAHTSTSFPTGTVRISGTFTPANVGGSGAGTTFEFNAASAQTIPSFTYGNLSTSTGGTKTLGGAIGVRGNLTISSSTTLDVSASNYAINVKGNWTNDGTFSEHSGTVTFANASDNTIGGTATTQTFYNIVIDKAGKTLSIGGSTTALTIKGSITLTAGIFSVGNRSIEVNGNWTNNSSSTTPFASTGTVTFSQNAAQTLGGSAVTTFFDLTVTGTSSPQPLTLTNKTVVQGTLTLTNRSVSTGLYEIKADNIVRNTVGHIIGKLVKSFSASGSVKTFEIGNAGNYLPVTVSFGTITHAGDLSVITNELDLAALPISNINTAKHIKRSWIVGSTLGLAFSDYSITFNYLNPEDHDGDPPLTTPGSFIAGLYGTSWSYPTVSGTPSATSLTATGITTTGAFQIGNSVIPSSSEGEELVYWTDLTGTEVNNDVLSKTATDGWTNGGAASENFLLSSTEGFVKYIIPNGASLTDVKAFGLSDHNADQNYTTIDHCFYLDGNSLEVFESGDHRGDAGSLQEGDVLIIKRVNGKIYYIKNDVIVYPISVITIVTDNSLLLVDASIYTQAGTFDGITCSFPFSPFIAEATIVNQTNSALGSISVDITEGYPTYEFIWDGVRYPDAASLNSEITSLQSTFNPIHVNSSLYTLFADLRDNQGITDIESGKHNAKVIDSDPYPDVHDLDFTVGKELEWLSTDGLDAATSAIPKWNNGQTTFYYGDGVTLTKTSSDGWSTGFAVSENTFGRDRDFYLQFSVPQILSELAVGLKPAINNSGINNLSALQTGFLFDNANHFQVLELGLILYSGEYSAGDFFSINRAFNPKTLRETFAYSQNGQEIATTDPETNNRSGYNSYRLGVNIYANGAQVSNVIITGYNFPELNAFIVDPSLCMPTGKIILDLSNLPLDNSLSYNLSYLWSTGATTQYISNIPIGTYIATVTAIASDSDTLIFTKSFIVPAKLNWKELTNTSVYDAKYHNSIKKNDETGNAWNAVATSMNFLPQSEEGYAQFKTQFVNDCVFGLSQFDLEAPGLNYGALATSYAINDFPDLPPVRLLLATYKDQSDGSPEATLIGVYREGDELKIKKTSSAVTLWKNSETSSLFNYPNYLDEKFFVKAFIYTEGKTIEKSEASFDCGELVSYGTLKNQPDASYYEVKDNKLRFVYTEEYTQGNLNYKIYDTQRNEIAIGGCAPNSNLLKQVGFNNYELDFSSCSLANGYYTLEILGEKKQFYVLRFKI